MATRVCAIYGSESGNSERRLKAMSAAWPKISGVAFSSGDIYAGQVAAAKGLDAIAASYDVIVICTSSYGDGDAPDNYLKFLAALYAAEGTGVFKGKQHAVLGFGSTDYETFQNCPRLSDKLMGELGSRRMLARVEVDENETLAGDAAEAKFAKDIVAAIKGAAKTANNAPACAWTVPEDLILDKKDELANYVKGGGVPVPALITAALVAAAAVAYFLFL